MTVSAQVGNVATAGLDWTAASTVVAAIAAVIALFVGVWPIVTARRTGEGQARFWAKVAVDDLAVQELNLLAATKLVTQPEGYADSWQYDQVAKCTATVSSAILVTLAQYREHLPKPAEGALVVAISILAVAQHRRTFLAQLAPSEVVNLTGDMVWYDEVREAIHPARVELAKWVKVELQQLDEGAAQLAKNLRHAALVERQLWQQANIAEARTADAGQRAPNQ
ncbi:hypothetical protein [Stenotrophomonas sp. AB1(2024)]|uniref:hypothetical protein n=1 Tax=Stenotrophomonas sp. AB1(2024) TaxID=3132215 RepID=UPI0030B2F508